MKQSHRAHPSFVLITLAGVSLIFLVAAANGQGDAWTREDAAHLLQRAGFGGTPAQIDKLYAMGKTAAVDYLINGPQQGTAKGAGDGNGVFPPAHLTDFDPAPAVTFADQRFDALGGVIGKAGAKAAGGKKAQATTQNADDQAALTPRQLQQKQRQFESRFVFQSLRQWWLDRMVRSDYPLAEKMTLFWHGILTSGAKEVKNGRWLADQNAMFHRLGMDNYKRLIAATIHDAAMLKYLNNDENVKGKPNENLARELMELFTMGEGNGYTEKDIAEVARALTGLMPTPKGVTLRPMLHDSGSKTIFGHTGVYGPDDVVDLIFAQPQPTQYLARRLWTFFVYPDPSDEDLAPVVAALRENKCDIKPALRAIFLSRDFYSDKAKFALIKSPTELAVETMRNLEIEPPMFTMVGMANQLRDMGQELLEPPNVRGWVGGEHWITAAALFLRYNLACALVDGTLSAPRGPAIPAAMRAAPMPAVAMAKLFDGLGNQPTPDQVVDAAISRFLQRPLNAEKRQALLQSMGAGPIQFGRADSDKRVREMVDLLLSTPEYQVH